MEAASAPDTIVVTSEWFGADDIAAKQSADGIIDVIGPDALAVQSSVDIAEALGRLPGVALETERGENQFVQLRGLRPELNSVTLDGVIIGAAESLGGGRQAPLDFYSTRLVTALELIKTPTPDMEGQGIGAVLNIETAGAQIDDAVDGWAGSASLLAGGGDGLDAAYEGAADILYADPSGLWAVRGALAVEAVDTDRTVFLQRSWGFLQEGFPELLRYEREDRNADRYAGSLAVSLFPADGHTVDLSYLRSHTGDVLDFHRYQDGEADFVPVNAAAGTLTSQPSARLRAIDEERDIQVARAFGTHAMSDEQTLSWRLVWSETTLQAAQEEWFVSGETLFAQPFAYTITDDPYIIVDRGGIPDYNSSGVRLTDFETEDRALTEDGLVVGLDYEHALFASFDLKVGAQWRRAERQNDVRKEIFDGAVVPLSVGGVLVDTPVGDVPFMDLSTNGLRTIFDQRPASALALNAVDSVFNSVIEDYGIVESVSAAYVMGRYEQGPLTVVGGVRFEQMDRDSTGNGILPTILGNPTLESVTQTERDADDTQWLPMIAAT